MDEALNPLTILSVGIYGKTLLNQNGAPIRLVVPWKYGFKSIKSIVKIEFVEDQPRNTWKRRHTARVRVLRERQPGRGSPALVAGDGAAHRQLLPQRTQRFNGYGYQVARMYDGMDLARNY